jgi:hypothetical protein
LGSRLPREALTDFALVLSSQIVRHLALFEDAWQEVADDIQRNQPDSLVSTPLSRAGKNFDVDSLHYSCVRRKHHTLQTEEGLISLTISVLLSLPKHETLEAFRMFFNSLLNFEH